MSNQKAAVADSEKRLRLLLIGAIMVLAFLAAYEIADATKDQSVATVSGNAAQPSYNYATGGPAGTAGSCGCGGSGETIEGAAVVEADGIQRIAVDATNSYNPNVIVLETGTPAEITFSQGSGCLAQVMSADLSFFEDLQSGPRTVALEGLAPGMYNFSCGMEMVFGQIVVQ
jgi:hypothetical protein